MIVLIAVICFILAGICGKGCLNGGAVFAVPFIFFLALGTAILNAM